MTRIIAGAAGSLRLEVPKAGTRPTSDRVREAIFSTLESWQMLQGANVCDLYGGSGALALEAISRGAASAVVVEKHPQAAQVAQRNARTVLASFSGAAPTVEVHKQGVQTFLDGSRAAHHFDVVLIDPPYDLSEDELNANLAALVPLLANDAAVMVERSTRTPEPRWPEGLTQFKEKRYGETVLWWAEPTTVEDASAPL